ncbi:MAG: TonB-linked SusC/RagA family outer membrane protein [Cognaticolwellia sp.]|jgi:TonB-linked SusC/RagA family outer membrane protein
MIQFIHCFKWHLQRGSLLLMLLAFCASGYAQVSGTIVDDKSGEPLIGASILVQGTSTGVISGVTGEFSLDAKQGDVLKISYIGYADKTVTIGAETNLLIRLTEGLSFDEIVVVGYASQTRGDITGSVASVDMSEALKAPVVNAAEALQGRVTGVTVVVSGRPGDAPKINVRGFGTSNNTNPLYIIDGVQTDDPNALNNLSTSDIQQMNVLKDAAAAIYGARASNGVVIITTKGGGYNMARPEIAFSAFTGSSNISNVPGLLNTQQHADMIWQSQLNDGGTPEHPQYGNGSTPLLPSSIQGYTRVVSYAPTTFAPAGQFSAATNGNGTNWVDAITQSAPVSSVNFSIANGEKNGKYYLSAGYLKRDGIIQQTGFERGNVKMNSEFKLGNKLKVGEHINVAFTNTKLGVNEAIENASRMTPLLPVLDDDGEYTGVAGPGLSNTRNPAAQLYRSRNDYNKRLSIFGDVYMSYQIIEGLTAKTVLAGGFNTFNSRYFTALDPEHGEPISTNTLAEQNQTAYNWNWTNTLNYQKSIGDHYINAIGGVEALKDQGKGTGISRQGYLFEDPNFYLLSNGSGAPNIDYVYSGYNTLFSIFGSVNYSFQDKYFATVTLRQDESSRFIGDNKRDIFPSLSAGWDVTKEAFFPQGSVLSRLKLKGSWGQLGNQTLPANNPTVNISNLNEALANYSFNGSSISTGALLSQVGNPDLKWETSVSTNFGIELGLLNNKLIINAEFYNIDTKDLITRDFSLISSTAIDAGAPLVNLGDIRNRGVDLELGYADKTAGGFGYDISFYVSRYKNEVISLINDAPVAGRQDLRNGAVTRTEVGGEMSYFYGRNITGLDDNGRFVYEDVNNDGVVNDDDRTNIGSPHPDFTYGINLKANYKGFDASVFFTGSQGNEIYNYNKVFTDFGLFFNGNRSTRVLDAWTPTNTDTDVPALTGSYPLEEASANTYFIEDGSYFRLKNLQVGYTLPDAISERANIQSVRIYIQGSNLLTITNYSGYDPEVISYDNLSLGVDRQIYPLSKGITFGTNIRF